MLRSAYGSVGRMRWLVPLLPLLLATGNPGFAAEGGGSSPGLAAVASAVEGAESSHGRNPRMWRPDSQGPQGPMQITAAAASDVGGGDRFDPEQNRALGRAYLEHMFRRFGSWGDAVTAYNWGPGRLDGWIRTGRPPDRLPHGVERYRQQVLSGSSAPEAFGGVAGPRRPRLLGLAHAQPRRAPGPPSSADRQVEALFAQVMSASASQ